MELVSKSCGQNSTLQSYSFLPAKQPNWAIKVLKNENLEQKSLVIQK